MQITNNEAVMLRIARDILHNIQEMADTKMNVFTEKTVLQAYISGDESHEYNVAVAVFLSARQARYEIDKLMAKVDEG